MAKERTINYIFTADPNNQNDLDRIAYLRKLTKGTKFRVNCKGRGYKDEATKLAYKTKAMANSYGKVDGIQLKDAVKWDVYVHGWWNYEQLPMALFMEVCRTNSKNN